MLSASTIQTLLSVLESHQFNLGQDDAWQPKVADYTAGREFHPAPKTYDILSSLYPYFEK